jgi:hypothetical protein
MLIIETMDDVEYCVSVLKFDQWYVPAPKPLSAYMPFEYIRAASFEQ